MMNDLVLTHGASTDVGLRRAINEDSMLIAHPLYVVADGMGGHAAGDRASQAVISTLTAIGGRGDLDASSVSRALESAHASVRLISEELEKGAGSTVTGVVVVDHADRPHWLVFNIGDSRVYRLRGAELQQLTTDHSLVQQLVDSGVLAKKDAATYPGRNVITRAVGASDSAADLWLYPVVAGDKIVLCSDGLTNEVSDESIRAVLLSTSDAQQSADGLVSRALAHGGRDNVTAVVVQVETGGISPDLDEATRRVARIGAVIDDELEEDTVPRIKRDD
jgi:protein phosphatase